MFYLTEDIFKMNLKEYIEDLSEHIYGDREHGDEIRSLWICDMLVNEMRIVYGEKIGPVYEKYRFIQDNWSDTLTYLLKRDGGPWPTPFVSELFAEENRRISQFIVHGEVRNADGSFSIEKSYEQKLREYLISLGFSEDYVIPFNVKMNASLIMHDKKLFNNPNGGHDFVWLCNKIAKAIRRYDNVDNFRMQSLNMGFWDCGLYADIKANGCCGFYDRVITNPKTGHTFQIGFNYGH